MSRGSLESLVPVRLVVQGNLLGKCQESVLFDFHVLQCSSVCLDLFLPKGVDIFLRPVAKNKLPISSCVTNNGTSFESYPAIDLIFNLYQKTPPYTLVSSKLQEICSNSNSRLGVLPSVSPQTSLGCIF